MQLWQQKSCVLHKHAYHAALLLALKLEWGTLQALAVSIALTIIFRHDGTLVHSQILYEVNQGMPIRNGYAKIYTGC